MNVIEIERIVPLASTMLKALGNSHRLMIVAYLLHGEMNVGELGRAIGLSQSALSQHLARLRRDGLVQTRREAQTIHYSLRGEEARDMVAALMSIYGEEAGAGSQDHPFRQPLRASAS